MKTIRLCSIALSSIILSCTTAKKENETLVSESKNQEIAAVLASDKVFTPTYAYVTAPSGLSLRKASNLRSEKMLTLPYGSQVQVVKRPKHTEIVIDNKNGAMIRVAYQGAEGYVFDGYLSTIAPPQADESVAAFASRISTTVSGVKLEETPNPKGAIYGKTTHLTLPVAQWEDAYSIAKKLYALPKNITLSYIKNQPQSTHINTSKNPHSLKDELTISRNNNGEITEIIYHYALRDYSRKVQITKNKNGFAFKEIETSK